MCFKLEVEKCFYLLPYLVVSRGLLTDRLAWVIGASAIIFSLYGSTHSQLPCDRWLTDGRYSLYSPDLTFLDIQNGDQMNVTVVMCLHNLNRLQSK